MLIQCQSCATRFRIDTDRIPLRKTFVRCKACGTPIYLDPTLEGEEATEWHDAGLIPAAEMEGAASGAPPFGAPSARLAAHEAAGHVPHFGESPEADGLLVQCPHCQSRYRVPPGPLQRPRIKLKCSVCGHIFAPPPLPSAAAGETLDSFFERHRDLAASARPVAPGGLDESALERLNEPPAPFSAPESDADAEQAYLDAIALDQEGETFPPAKKVPEDQKYRLFLQPDAFKAGHEAAPPAAPPAAAPPAAAPPAAEMPAAGTGLGEMPTAADGAASAPGGETAAHEEFVLPPLEGDLTLDALEPVAPAGSKAAAPETGLPESAGPESAAPAETQAAPVDLGDDLPPLDEDTDEGPTAEELAQSDVDLAGAGKGPAGRGPAAAADMEFDVDALPLDAFEKPKPMAYEPPPPPPLGDAAVIPFEAPTGKERARPSEETILRDLAPGQVGWLTDRHRLLVLAVLAGVMVGAIIAWGGWLAKREDAATRPFTFEIGRAKGLALDETLDGRALVHRSGTRLFVVEGQLLNRFPKGVKVSWVRLRGKIYADTNENQLLGSTQAYLGNVLTQEQLQTMDLAAIAAYGAYNNGRDNVDFEIPSGRRVPFQLVFVDVNDPVQRTVAEVVSYVRDGLTVYVDVPEG